LLAISQQLCYTFKPVSHTFRFVAILIDMTPSRKRGFCAKTGLNIRYVFEWSYKPFTSSASGVRWSFHLSVYASKLATLPNKKPSSAEQKRACAQAYRQFELFDCQYQEYY
jgi:hypothetical protein